MLEKLKILIIDDNIEFNELLKQFINRDLDMETVGTAKDGMEGIEMIKKHSPDVIILDLIMPNIDGLGVLEKLKEMSLPKKPMSIVLSAVGQDMVARKTLELGAEYYMIKPIDIDLLLKRVKEIYSSKINSSYKSISHKTSKHSVDVHLKDMEHKIISNMHDLGVPAHLSGYRYLKEAITLALNDSEVFSSVTKILYPSVAEKCKSTPQKVERSIRNAIEITWAKKSNALKRIFREECDELNLNKPTNTRFIAVVVDIIKIDLNIG